MMYKSVWPGAFLAAALLAALLVWPVVSRADLAANSDIDLLILAHQDFVAALQPLKEHKEYTGIRTHILSWQSLSTAYAAQGRDDPERIKRGIAAYQVAHRVHTVMLVGDSDRFPVRYCRAANTEWGSKYYPSDLYYADLYNANGAFDDWDGNGNGIFCEMDFSGGNNINLVNTDSIHMLPELMVGRVPASNVNEVTTYVNKVIGYEFAAYKAEWSRKALLVVDGGAGAFGDEGKMDALGATLSGHTLLKRYADNAPYSGMNDGQRAAEINDVLNAGVGLAFYYGHGNRLGWTGWYDQTNLGGLTNGSMLPIIFATSCYTGRFHFDREYYITAANVQWDRLAGPWPPTNYPLPNSVQPAYVDEYGKESLAEEFLVKQSAGGVAYIGSVSKAEHGVWIAANQGLAHYFASTSNFAGVTLGGMWRYAMAKYINDEVIPLAMDWYRFIHIHKMMLFGDPSLRLGGVSRIQKQDLAGTYTMVHDGWKGTLRLQAADDSPIEAAPNLTGTWTAPEGYLRGVRGYMRTWSYPQPPAFGPDHKALLYIDFPDSLPTEDDSKFEGYLFTRTKEAIAGLTYWNNTPFGFYALRGGTTGGLGAENPGSLALGPLGKQDFLGSYRMNHDGWKGKLELWAVPDDPIEQQPNVRGRYTGDDGAVYNVRGYVRTPSYPLDVSWGPDHKIELRIDFANTPDIADDAKFDGYLFTQTRNGLAGLTWWQGTPFGFFALKQSLVYLPLVLAPGP